MDPECPNPQKPRTPNPERPEPRTSKPRTSKNKNWFKGTPNVQKWTPNVQTPNVQKWTPNVQKWTPNVRTPNVRKPRTPNFKKSKFVQKNPETYFCQMSTMSKANNVINVKCHIMPTL